MDASYLPRPYLEEEILRSVTAPTSQGVLLVGPGGSGKTATLRHFAEVGREHDVWVLLATASENRGTEAVGWQIVQQVLLERHPYWSEGVSGSDLDRLRTIGEQIKSSFGRQSQELFAEFLNEMATFVRPGVQVAIAIDGLDNAFDREAASQLVSFLINRKPRAFKVIAASRNVTSLAELASRELMYTIEIPKLTDYEVRQLIAREAGIPKNDEHLLQRAIGIINGSPLSAMLVAQQLKSHGELPLDLSPGTIQDVLYSRILVRAIPNEEDRAQAERLLVLLALFSPIPMQELAQLAGGSTERNLSLIHETRSLMQSTSRPDGTVIVGLFHQDLRATVLRQSIGFESVDIALLHFGAEEAERDKALQSSFMPPPSADLILSGDKSIVLGERGSGKSAIFRAILNPGLLGAAQTLQEGWQNSAIIVPADEPAAFIGSVVESGASDTSAERYRAAWLLYTSALVSPTIRSMPGVPKDLYKDAWRVLRSVGWQGKDIVVPRRLEKIRHWALEAIFSKVNKVAFGPVTIEPKFDGAASSFSRKPLDLASFLDRCDARLQRVKKQALVIVDRIDEIAKYERKQQERLVQGLMMAESYLAQKAALKLVVLLRTDLFELYDIQEKNKFISRIVRLEWDLNQLLGILMRRIFANEQLSKLADALRLRDLQKDVQDNISLRIVFPDIVEGMPIRQWLAEHLANGKGRISPRQIILLLLLAQEEATHAGMERLCPLFDETAVRTAMTRLSELSYGEVISDYRVSSTFVKNCRAGKYREFTIKQVEPLFDLQDGPVAAQTELLERLGFLKRFVTHTEGGPESRFRIPPLYARCWEAE